jgi:hypothetical protein
MSNQNVALQRTQSIRSPPYFGTQIPLGTTSSPICVDEVEHFDRSQAEPPGLPPPPNAAEQSSSASAISTAAAALAEDDEELHFDPGSATALEYLETIVETADQLYASLGGESPFHASQSTNVASLAQVFTEVGHLRDLLFDYYEAISANPQCKRARV